MRCNQCPRPAFYLVGQDDDIPLCIDCYEKVSRIEYRDFIQNAAMTNHAMDEMDAISGFPIAGGRMPIGDLVKMGQKLNTYNNITISESQIGVVNTGDLVRIDAAITLSKGSDVEEVGRHVGALAQAVMDSGQIDAQQRAEIVELLQELSDQAIKGRKKSVMSSIMRSISEKTSGIIGLATLSDKLLNALESLWP
jgi:hypothetical protein